MFDAILIDLDSTLIASLPFHYKAYKIAFEEVGLKLEEDFFYANCSSVGKETIKRCINNQVCNVSLEDIHKRKLEIYSNILEEMPMETLEFSKLLPVFFGKYKLALVSSGNKSNIMKVLNKLDWNKYFSSIITGDDVKNGKPHPEPFISAAKALNVQAKNCLAVGDTDADEQSAKAAGMAFFDIRLCHIMPKI